MWHVSAVPLEWAINPNFRLSADGEEFTKLYLFGDLALKFKKIFFDRASDHIIIVIIIIFRNFIIYNVVDIKIEAKEK